VVRVVFYLIVIFLIAAGAAWLADRPGTVTLAWQGEEIRASLLTVAVALLALIGALALLGAIVRAVLNSPRTFGAYLGARRRDRGYRALSTGMIAVGAGDLRLAQRASGEATALLRDEPLTLLLAAQTAQLAGDREKARIAFEALAEGRHTRVLGLHGLFVEATRQGESEAARHFAEEAMRAAPRIGWAGTALFEYQARSGYWLGALATLTANAAARLVDRNEARRLRAVLLTARANDLEAGDPAEAEAAATEAHRLSPGLAPAATVAARLLARRGEPRRAARVLETTWKIAPHPEVAEAYAAVRTGDTAKEKLKRMRRLLDLRPDSVEGAIALARVAIDARDFGAARAALRVPAEVKPSERICLLMAEIEEEEHGDQGRVRSWLTRALTAPRDPRWVADGQAFDRWAPVSPLSGRVGAFTWTVQPEREERAGRPIELERAAGGAAAPGASGEPEPPPAAMPLPGVHAEVLPAPPLAPLRNELPATERPPLSASAAGLTMPTRPPDDPGPPDEEGDRQAARPF